MTAIRTALLCLGLVLTAACSESDEGDGAQVPIDVADVSTTIANDVARFDLRDACPATVVVQTDWYPQAEHGGIYELLGDDYEVDAQTGATRGSLVFQGTDTGINLEIRAGGPFLESPVVTEMFLDDSIMFGYVGTDVAISRYADTPTLAVFNALTVNPQVILWNADTHPNASSIADIAQEVPAISVFGDRPFMRYFVAQGLVPADKVDGNYKGSLLLATDDVAHQGFVTSEPFRYSTLESGAVATGFQLIHDAGWTSYPQNLAINKLRLDALRPCLIELVPLMQQAQIDFIADPQRTIEILLDVVVQLNTSWTQSVELANYAVDAMRSLGIVDNGSTDTFGDFESPRLDDFVALAIPILREQGLDIPDISAADVATNEFIDTAISMP
jgi:hypothetical protein